MTLDQRLLKVMLRLGRRREPADLDALVLRSGAPAAEVRACMRRLHNLGWVERRPNGPPRLTFSGFAVAVAMLPGKVQRGVTDALNPSRAA